MEDPAAGRDPPERRRRAAERQRGGEDRRRRLAGGEQRAERRRIATGGGEVAEGEVDAADEAVDQRIGCRQERVDRRQRQAVERLLHRIGGGTRQTRQIGDVAERGGVGVARFRRRQPEAREEIEADVAERPAVDRQRDHFVGAQRPAGLAEAAVGEMGRTRSGGIETIDDAQAAPVGKFVLAEDFDGRIGRGDGRQRHSAEAGLIGLDQLRAAGERQSGDEDGEKAPHASRSRAARRRCLARLPQTSISHQRRRLFLVSS